MSRYLDALKTIQYEVQWTWKPWRPSSARSGEQLSIRNYLKTQFLIWKSMSYVWPASIPFWPQMVKVFSNVLLFQYHELILRFNCNAREIQHCVRNWKCYIEQMSCKNTGFFIMNVTFKQVIKRAKRIVCTLIVCSTGCKLFRIYAGSKSLTIRRVSFSYGSGMSAPSKRVIFPFLDDDAVQRHWLLSSTALYRVWHQFDESLESTFISEGLIFSYE